MENWKKAVGVFGAVVLACLAGVARAEDTGWQSSISVGGSATSGNSETINASAGTAVARETDTWALRVGAEGQYGESETDPDVGRETTVQSGKAHVNAKTKSGAVYGYTDDSILHDDIAGLDYRAIAGGGGGVYLLQSEGAKLSVELGAAYVNEKSAGVKDDFASFRAAARHEQVLSETARSWASAEYLPRADEFGEYLLNTEAGIEASINSSLSLRVVVQDRYDSEPPAGIKENDLSVIASLVYALL